MAASKAGSKNTKTVGPRTGKPGRRSGRPGAPRPRRLSSGARSEDSFEGLLDLLALEERDALPAYALHVDQASMPQSAPRARLGATERDRAMSLQGERLRLAIDRRQRAIASLLRTLGAHHAVGQYNSLYSPANPASRPFSAKKTKKKNLKFYKTKPLSPVKSIKRPQKQAKTKPNEAKPGPT
jgi:hypothetical protein